MQEKSEPRLVPGLPLLASGFLLGNPCSSIFECSRCPATRAAGLRASTANWSISELRFLRYPLFTEEPEISSGLHNQNIGRLYSESSKKPKKVCRNRSSPLR